MFLNLKLRTFMKNSVMLLLLLAMACSKSDGSKSSPDAKSRTINYAQAAEDFSLEEDAFGFRTPGHDYIRMSVPLNDNYDDFKVVYDQPQGEGFIEITSVVNGSSSENLEIQYSDNREIVLISSGWSQYYCSISISNDVITDVDGKCALKVRVHLPAGARIEIYNNGELKSKRFFGMKEEDFKEYFNSQRSDEDRIKALGSYIKSFSHVGSVLDLEGEVLEYVLRKMNFPDDKMKAFRILHRYISDRVELKKIVDSVFSYFDRQDAYRIAGLGEVD